MALRLPSTRIGAIVKSGGYPVAADALLPRAQSLDETAGNVYDLTKVRQDSGEAINRHVHPQAD
jgi:hypothetical protein